MNERSGLTHRSMPLTWLGKEVKIGEKALDFTVRTAFGQATIQTLASTAGKIRIFSIAPSLDTGVCEMQAMRFNQEAEKLSDDVVIVQISVDLPPAQGRFCKMQLAGDAKVKMVSDYAEKSFGMNYGYLIKEWQVLARGIVVVDKDDIVRYVEYVPAIEQQVNFDAALAAVKKL